MRWLRRRRETRASAGGFTAAVTDALLDLAAGGTLRNVQATAALEACSGLYARALATATVEPRTTLTASVTPSVLAMIGRELIRTGESIHVIEIHSGRPRLLPAGSWDVRGSAMESDWWVRADIFGPSGNRTVLVPHEAVIHPRYSVEPSRPWLGVGPLGWARATGQLAANLEGRLADEAGGPSGHLIPVPIDGDDAGLTTLRKNLGEAQGGTMLVESTAGGFGDAQAAPRQDWVPRRFGADPPEVLALLRSDSALQVANACGVAGELITGTSPGTGRREAWRQFLHASAAPVAKLVAQELSEKLEIEVTLNLDDLHASDVSGRARAFQSLVGGGMDVTKAAGLKKLCVAVSGPPRAIEIVPSSCGIPVSEVRSSAMGGNDSVSVSGFRPPWTTAIRIESSGWFSACTVRKKVPSS